MTDTDLAMRQRQAPGSSPEGEPAAAPTGGRPGGRKNSAEPDRLVAALSPRRMAAVLGGWAAWYAGYRLYYALGGQLGMVGRPAQAVHFRSINLVGGVLILAAAVLPAIVVSAWRYRPVRRLVPVIGFIAAVGCAMHALTLETLRLLSLTGLHATQVPSGLWLSYDRHQADLQDALFNEPWFFITGCLWGLFGITALGPSHRRLWLNSAAGACLLATAVGVLSGLHVIPTVRWQ